MAPAREQRLDFMVLNHDEDLISTTMRAQLTAVYGAVRKQATRVDTAVVTAYVLATDEKTDGVAPLGKPDIVPILVPQDPRKHATTK